MGHKILCREIKRHLSLSTVTCPCCFRLLVSPDTTLQTICILQLENIRYQFTVTEQYVALAIRPSGSHVKLKTLKIHIYVWGPHNHCVYPIPTLTIPPCEGDN